MTADSTATHSSVGTYVEEESLCKRVDERMWNRLDIIIFRCIFKKRLSLDRGEQQRLHVSGPMHSSRAFEFQSHASESRRKRKTHITCCISRNAPTENPIQFPEGTLFSIPSVACAIRSRTTAQVLVVNLYKSLKRASLYSIRIYLYIL